MDRRLLVFCILIVVVPGLTAAAVVRAGIAGGPPSERAAAVVVATSDARSVGAISLPFLVLGTLVMVAYRRGVVLYQRWCKHPGPPAAVWGPGSLDVAATAAGAGAEATREDA